MPMTSRSDLNTPRRNHYFYGKLLDAYHFELETDYFNAKRWLINRLVLGYGVVCGLGVEPGAAPNSVVLAPGVAIDKWGREIVVPNATDPYVIPDDVIERAREIARGSAKPVTPAGPGPGTGPAPARGAPAPATGYTAPTYLDVQVLLCYHECPADPVPVLAGDCPSGPCAPGSIREQFRVEFREGKAPPFAAKCHLTGVIGNGWIDYPELTRIVSRGCHEVPKSPCIVLANVRISDGDPCPCRHEDVDITVRRIVYSNDLLFELVLGLVEVSKPQPDSQK
jgi:hypothetical protein